MTTVHLSLPERDRRRLRIIHCFRAPVGGLFRNVRDLATEQARLGHDVGLICDSRASDPLTEKRLSEIAHLCKLGILRVPMSRNISFRDWLALRPIREYVQAQQAEILHGHGAKGGGYARLTRAAMRRSGSDVRSFYTPHGGAFIADPASIKHRFFAAIERSLTPLTDGLVFESQWVARLFAESVGAPPLLTRVVPNGLLPEEFETSHAPIPDAADFVFIGELRKVKGVDVLLRAIQLVNVMVRVRAVIVGSGSDERRLRELAGALGVADVVTFAGTMPAREAFRLAHTLVVPSLAESLPYVVLEAAAAAVPLVATNVGGISEIVEGVGQHLVRPGDHVALAEEMLATHRNMAGARRRAEGLKVAVRAKFDARRMSSDICNMYAEAMEGRCLMEPTKTLQTA